MKKESIKQSERDFVVLAASIATGVLIEDMNQKTRITEIVLARSLVYHHFRQFKVTSTSGGMTHKHSLHEISNIFLQDHASVLNGVRLVDKFLWINDKETIRARNEFVELLKFESMEQLLQEAERRQAEKNALDKDREANLKLLKDYRRKYNKVVAKLIRTEQRPPDDRDFDLLNHILNH